MHFGHVKNGAVLIDINFLTGKSFDQLVFFLGSKHLVHRNMIQDLTNLFSAGHEAGFDFDLTSSFRSFETQKLIWEEKVLGVRKVLDSNSNPIDISMLANENKLFSCILEYFDE